MCKEGVNYTQFKLAIHQSVERGKLLEKSLEQWKSLLHHDSSEALAHELGVARDKISEAVGALEKALAEANKLSSGDDSDVTITAL